MNKLQAEQYLKRLRSQSLPAGSNTFNLGTPQPTKFMSGVSNFIAKNAPNFTSWLRKKFNQPVNLTPKQLNTMQDVGYSATKFTQGLKAIPFVGGPISTAIDPSRQESWYTKNILSGMAMPSTPATETGKVAGSIAELVPATMLIALGGKSKLFNKGKLANLPIPAQNLLATGGSNALIGAALNKAFGGSALEGAKSGYLNAPGISLVGHFTNPFIEKTAGSVYKSLESPIAKQLITRSVTGGLNVLEGLPMNLATGQPTTKESAAIDFLSGMILSTPANAQVKSMFTKAIQDNNVDAFEQAVKVAKKQGIKIDNTKAEKVKQAIQTNKVGGGDLISEARKYKSAEEFVNKIAKTDDTVMDGLVGYTKKNGSWVQGLTGTKVTNSQKIARLESLLKGNKKPYDAVKDLFNDGELWDSGQLSSQQKQVLEILESKGFIEKIKGNPTENMTANGVADIWKPKAQLTDIWNQANKVPTIKIKSPETKLEPVKQQSIEEAFPQAEIEKSLEDEIRQSANIKEPSFIPRKIEEPKLNVLQKIKQSWNRVFDPKATLPKNSQEAVTKWNATQQMAKTDANYLEREGNLVASKVGIQDPELKEKLLYYSQNPTESSAKELDLSPEVIKQAQPYLNWHKEFNDEIFSMYKEGLLDAKGNPINIGYLKNHVFQLFEERPEIIEKLIKDKGLSTFPGFAKHRIIPDFQTAKKLGLHPKYTTMEQLDAALLEVFGKSKANIDFSKHLAETGDLVAFGDAPSNWQPITSRFFPKAPNGEIFYASPDLAKTLNNIFGADTTKSFIDRGLETTAKISGTMQDVKLTGGAYTINAFTIGQTIRDTALGLGEIAKLHPIKGGKIIEASWETMFRNLTPGASQRFELNPDNKQAVKELINEGWNYGGDLNYRKAQPNTSISKDLKDSIKGEGLKNTWDEISNRPTFRKYLWQKRVDIFKIVRDDLVSKGKSYDEAVRLAAANTKNYEGVISDLGRDKSVQNFLQTFVMAPKYREGLLKSGQNIVKGFTTQIKNPEFAQSRSLGIGMGLLFVLYDQLNRKFNKGKHLWENPPGKELELVIPDGEGGYTSIPFMPGTTAIYRRAFGSIAALYKGDVQEAGKQASSLLSIPVSGISTLVTGKDYWGNDVYDPNRPSVLGNGPASKAEQMGIQTVKSFAPGYVEQPIQYAQDLASYKYRKNVLKKNATEPNKIKYGLRALEIPVKQGTFSPAYFTAKDEVLKKYSKEDIAAYEATHPTTGTFERKEPKTDIEKMKINLDKATNPNIYMMEKEIALKEAELSKKEVDPLYKVPMEVALRMYKYDSYEPGSKDKKDYGKAHPEIFELKDLRAGFFERNPIDGGTPYNGPVASEYVQKQMDLKNWKDPQVKAYLEANREYTNERRKALGLEPLAAYSGGSGGYNPMKYFKPKVKTVKMKKLRLKKLPKIKKAKRKTYKKIATKKITIKPIKGIKIKKPKSIGKIKVRS